MEPLTHRHFSGRLFHLNTEYKCSGLSIARTLQLSTACQTIKAFREHGFQPLKEYAVKL
jgi:hypothetical protein